MLDLSHYRLVHLMSLYILFKINKNALWHSNHSYYEKNRVQQTTTRKRGNNENQRWDHTLNPFHHPSSHLVMWQGFIKHPLSRWIHLTQNSLYSFSVIYFILVANTYLAFPSFWIMYCLKPGLRILKSKLVFHIKFCLNSLVLNFS